MSNWKKYTSHEMHRMLLKECLSNRYLEQQKTDDWIENQALFCPYYVTCEGKLGGDWGVIVNPQSSRFTKLTFEHDECGCPTNEKGFAIHGGGEQIDNEWLK